MTGIEWFFVIYFVANIACTAFMVGKNYRITNGVGAFMVTCYAAYITLLLVNGGVL